MAEPTAAPSPRDRMVDLMAFEVCLRTAVETPALLEQYDRLAGTDILRRRPTLEQAIDDATGHRDDQLRGFFDFVREYVWNRGPEEMRAGLRALVAPAVDAALAELERAQVEGD